MAFRKFIFVNLDGDYEELTPNTDSIALDTFTTGGTSATVPSGGGAMGGNLEMDSNRIIGLADPVGDQDAATKAFVIASLDGLDVKQSVLAATTSGDGNITFSGSAPDTIDGISVKTLGARILVKNQTAPAENGIYEVTVVGGGTDDNTWARSSDADTIADFNANAFTFVEEGSTNEDTGWVVTTEPATLGTDPITWTQFSKKGVNTASFGVEIVSNDIRLNLEATGDGTGGLEITSDEVGINFSVSPFNQDGRPVQASDLASTSAGEGASIIGIQDVGAFFTGTDVEAALQEIGADLASSTLSLVTATTDGTGVTKGDLLYYSANDIVSTMPISSLHRAIGVAAETVGASSTVSIIRQGIVTGVISSATAGDQYWWSGSAWTATQPSTSGNYVWRIGVAANADDGLIWPEFVKKNS